MLLVSIGETGSEFVFAGQQMRHAQRRSILHPHINSDNGRVLY